MKINKMFGAAAVLLLCLAARPELSLGQTPGPPVDPTTNFKVGGFLEFGTPFVFQSGSNLQRFQDGEPVSDEDSDEERPMCTLGLKSGAPAGPVFKSQERIEIRGSAKRAVGDLQSEVYYLKDARVSVLLCWGGPNQFPTLADITASLGAHIVYVPVP